MPENRELRAAARSQLKGGWLPAVGVVLVYSLLTGVSGSALCIPLIIVGGPLTLGLWIYFLHKARGEEAEIENLFEGFKTFGPSFLLYVLEAVFITLWSFLFVIPGLIKTLSYSMAFFILRDNPGMKALDAISASRKMMKGHKGRLFCLYLSFTGWALLALLTLGIGFLWLCPYAALSMANFYENLKKVQGQGQGEAETVQG